MLSLGKNPLTPSIKQTIWVNMKLILLGPPGTGKGTQAKLLIKHFKIPQISTGDILRQAVTDATELGRKAKSYMDSGALVPDEVIIGIIKERIKKKDCANGFIFDGFPRTIPQAEVLDKIIAIDYVIELQTSDKIIIKRLSARRQCKACGSIYGLDIIPKKHGICDKCSGMLYQRDDDKEEAIKNRLKVYHSQTKPLTEFYKKKGTLIEINGEQEISKIFQNILQSLE